MGLFCLIDIFEYNITMNEHVIVFHVVAFVLSQEIFFIHSAVVVIRVNVFTAKVNKIDYPNTYKIIRKIICGTKSILNHFISL